MRWFVVAVLLAGCGKGQEPPPPSSGRPNMERESGPGWGPVADQGPATGSAAPAAGNAGANDKAKATFAMVCQMCHGPDGKGNGPMASQLPVKPRDYSDPAWQASITDEQIKKAITEGGKGVGKSEAMPANPQLAQDPAKLDGLVALIRSFKR